MLNSEDVQYAVNMLKEAVEKAPKQLNILHKELQLCDKEISDIYHTIEKINFNASDGFKIYKDLQITLQRRRDIKNEIDILKQIKDENNKQRTIAHQLTIMDNVFSKHNNRIENATYTPRVRRDLDKYHRKSWE